MTTATLAHRPRNAARIVGLGAGLLFVWSSGIHVGIASADPQLYTHMADGAWFPGIRTAWREIFMAHPRFWGLAVSVGELAIGLLLLRGGRAARAGLVGAVGFHIGLMLLGWGFWMWSVPALAVLLGPAAIPRGTVGDLRDEDRSKAAIRGTSDPATRLL